IECVTLWGVADDYTWLDNFPARNRKNWPLLFDEENNPKEAFYRIINF
ncbi:MAG TPA: 1,4-beta-xylanase, partial [Lachnospiraceae bacterium]|nr:1,4-beta-xylanase [Lachnospiraceae bacterium]